MPKRTKTLELQDDWLTPKELHNNVLALGIDMSYIAFRKRFITAKRIRMVNISKGKNRPTYRIRRSVAETFLERIQSKEVYFPRASKDQVESFTPEVQ